MQSKLGQSLTKHQGVNTFGKNLPVSVTNFSNLPQNLKNLPNTYQFWWKYPPKTYLLIRKKPTFLIFQRARSVVCFYSARAEGMLQIKLWTLGLIIKIYKQTIALFICWLKAFPSYLDLIGRTFQINFSTSVLDAFLTQIPTFVQKTDHLPTSFTQIVVPTRVG